MLGLSDGIGLDDVIAFEMITGGALGTGIIEDDNEIKQIRTNEKIRMINQISGSPTRRLLYFKSKANLMKILKEASLNFGIYPTIEYKDKYYDQTNLSFSNEDEEFEFDGVKIHEYQHIFVLDIDLTDGGESISVRNKVFLYAVIEAIIKNAKKEK